MIITYNDALNQKIADMIDIDSININLNTAVTKPVSEGIEFDDYESVKKNALELRARLKLMNTVYSQDESLIAAMLFNMFTVNDSFQFVPEVLSHNIIRASRIYHDPEDFEKDPYISNIEFDGRKDDKAALEEVQYNKYELFFYDNNEIRDPGIRVPKLAAADFGFRMPCVKFEGKEVFALTPAVINSMKPYIENAEGKVLVLGCGMGYFAYMASLNENVESVTVVENDPYVIRMFRELILPQFKDGSKITLIEEDAYSYIEKADDGQYDYCLADLWDNNSDVIPYLILRKICSGFEKTNIEYYSEKNILDYIGFYVHQVLIRHYQDENGMDTAPVSDFIQAEQERLKFFTDLLSDVEITSEDSFDRIIDPERIRDLFIEKSEIKPKK